MNKHILNQILCFVKGRVTLAIANTILNSTEEKIKEYYRHLEVVERLEHRTKLLDKQKADIEADIKNSNITLQCALQGIDYEGVRVQTSNTTSQQDKALERAFERLEKQLEDINCEILESRILKRKLEQKNNDITFIINKLNDSAKCFVIMRYKERKSYRTISDILHSSTASVSRLRIEILEAVSKWMCAYF